MPLSRGTLSSIAPTSAALRADLLPARPERVVHAFGPAVPLAAATLSVDPDSSLQAAARLAGAWLLFHCVLRMKNDPRALVRFARVVVFNSVLLALFSISQALTWNGQIYWSRPVPVASAFSVGGPFLSHNHLAAYLNMGLGLALGLSARRQVAADPPWRFAEVVDRLWRRADCDLRCHVAFPQRVPRAVGRLSRIRHLRARPLAPMGVGLAVLLVIAGLFLALLGSYSSYTARLLTILDLGDQGYQARLGVWQGAIRAWWERPVWGSGLGAFPVAITPHLTRELTVFFTRAENEYVDMLVEGGVVGVLLVLTFMVSIGGLARARTAWHSRQA